jgi:hypothetical protein
MTLDFLTYLSGFLGSRKEGNQAVPNPYIDTTFPLEKKGEKAIDA